MTSKSLQYNTTLYVLHKYFYTIYFWGNRLLANVQSHHLTADEVAFIGGIGSKIHVYMVFAYKCVLVVCGHNHPTMIKNP